MEWILIVYQIVSINNYSSREGFTNLGEFQTQKACYAAATQLAKINEKPRFICVKKGD